MSDRVKPGKAHRQGALAPRRTDKNGIAEEGYKKAVELLRSCATQNGFVASPTDRSNYRRVWGRDGAIMGLAALATGESDLVEAAVATFRTLARHQGPHGEIPSNVDEETGRVSYGGTTGRVDADLWFMIGCTEVWLATGDERFLRDMHPVIEQVRFLLGAWEYNNRGLLYVPQTGDWADEYVHHGYILYDQILYVQAQRSLQEIHQRIHDSVNHDLSDRTQRLMHLIRANYWFADGDENPLPDDVYHEVMYRKGRASARCREGRFWMPFFSPQGYGYRFDTLANVFASLLGVADDDRRSRVDQYIDEQLVRDDVALLPAFHPVIKPEDGDWQHLQMNFSYKFKNEPYEYHNGGLWPMVTGFYVADLANRNRSLAQRYADGIHWANRLTMQGEPWGFPEYVHGKKLTAEGTRHQGWSAAAAIIAEAALQRRPLFRVGQSQRKPA